MATLKAWLAQCRVSTNNFTGPRGHAPKSHVSMMGASYSLNEDEEAQFYKVYAAAVLERGEPAWIVERPTPKTRLFIDLDLEEAEGTVPDVLGMVRRLQRALGSFFPSASDEEKRTLLRVLVTTAPSKASTSADGSPRVKHGVHLHFPAVILAPEQVKAFVLHAQRVCQAELPRSEPQNAWTTVLDLSVYVKPSGQLGSGLRMIGSRKGGMNFAARKFEDSGRPYKLAAVLDGDSTACAATLAFYTQHPMQLVQHTSIRVPRATTCTEGFTVPAGAAPVTAEPTGQRVKRMREGALGEQQARAGEQQARAGEQQARAVRPRLIVSDEVRQALLVAIRASSQEYAQVALADADQLGAGAIGNTQRTLRAVATATARAHSTRATARGS